MSMSWSKYTLLILAAFSAGSALAGSCEENTSNKEDAAKCNDRFREDRRRSDAEHEKFMAKNEKLNKDIKDHVIDHKVDKDRAPTVDAHATPK